MDDNFCPAAGDSDDQTNAWLDIYGPPIVKRLETAAPGVTLTNMDVYSLISMCAFHTVAHDTLSPFCSLFSQQEFQAFDYSGDLDKYYGTAYGQPLGPVQGVGYINELIARLTNSPVVDETQTNTTLTGSPKTFPLDRNIYADFSHDNQMVAIYAAMGLFRPDVPLSTAGPTAAKDKRVWVTGKIVPFAGRMVVERLQCGKKRDKAVRILINDAVQPLGFCGDGTGICELGAFIKSQVYARNNGDGDWPKCFLG